MASQFEKYRTRGDTLNDDYFNTRWRDVDARLVDVEGRVTSIDDAAQQLIALGLAQLQAQLDTAIEGVQTDVQAAQQAMTQVEQALDDIEQLIDDLTSGALPAASVTVAAIAGLTATNAQAALAEHQIDIQDLNTAVGTKAPLASPALTGTPTAPTAAPGTDTAQLSTTAFVQAAITALLGGAPGSLNALNELAAALGNDPNFATTIASQIGGKVAKAGDTMTGDLTIDKATPSLIIKAAAAGQVAAAYLRTGTANRWALIKDSVTEGGSNAGSNLLVNRYNDAGTLLGTALSVARSNGDASFEAQLQAASFNTSSDMSLKSDVRRIKSTTLIDAVLGLVPHTFRWKRNGPKGPREIGFIAQHVESVLPDAVETDHNGIKSIKVMPLVALAVGKIQQQEREILALKQRLAALEARHGA